MQPMGCLHRLPMLPQGQYGVTDHPLEAQFNVVAFLATDNAFCA